MAPATPDQEQMIYGGILPTLMMSVRINGNEFVSDINEVAKEEGRIEARPVSFSIVNISNTGANIARHDSRITPSWR